MTISDISVNSAFLTSNLVRACGIDITRTWLPSSCFSAKEYLSLDRISFVQSLLSFEDWNQWWDSVSQCLQGHCFKSIFIKEKHPFTTSTTISVIGKQNDELKEEKEKIQQLYNLASCWHAKASEKIHQLKPQNCTPQQLDSCYSMGDLETSILSYPKIRDVISEVFEYKIDDITYGMAVVHHYTNAQHSYLYVLTKDPDYLNTEIETDLKVHRIGTALITQILRSCLNQKRSSLHILPRESSLGFYTKLGFTCNPSTTSCTSFEINATREDMRTIYNTTITKC